MLATCLRYRRGKFAWFYSIITYSIVREVKVASLNVTSFTKHTDELRIMLSNNPLDVIFINETRLDETIMKTIFLDMR